MATRSRQARVRAPMLFSAAVTWLPVLVGIGVLTGFLIYGIAARTGVDLSGVDTQVTPDRAAGGRLPTASGTPAPEATEVPIDAETEAPPTEPPTEAPTTHPPPDPPEPDVAGSYRVEESFPHEFTGQILITNNSGHARDWVVHLVYPASVGELREFWVDGTTQPKAQLSGNRYTFTSKVPVGAESHVVLNVQFARSGEDVDPTACTVNGTPCDGG